MQVVSLLSIDCPCAQLAIYEKDGFSAKPAAMAS
jgi:hypothetical protein